MKGRILEKSAAIVCALCLAVGVMSGVVFARDDEPVEEATAEPEATFVVLDWEDVTEATAMPEEEPASADELLEETPSEEVPVEPETPAPAAEVTDNRTAIPFYVGDTLWGELPIVNGVPYAVAYDFCRALGLSASESFSDGVYTVIADGLEIRASEGRIWFSCNKRCLLVENGVQVMGGQVCLPVEALAKCLGASVSWDQVRWNITAAGDVYPLESGETFYDETDLYWLSRVIYAEAGDQPLRGMIAVGDVVLNRMASDDFEDQNTVYDVIFAKNQFEVVINGMIYMEPSEAAVTAAKLALEGYDVTGGCTCFATYYFGEGYECVMWIGDHCFMVET